MAQVSASTEKKEFKSAVSAINKDIKVLGSEMSKVTAKFGGNADSMDAARAKADVLTSNTTRKKKKIDTLRTVLKTRQKNLARTQTKQKTGR